MFENGNIHEHLFKIYIGRRKNMKKQSRLSIMMGAAFLMATSAIGPGFLTQTTVFT